VAGGAFRGVDVDDDDDALGAAFLLLDAV